MKKIGLILTLVTLSLSTAFADEIDSSPFVAQGSASISSRGCWGDLYPCEEAEAQMIRFARNTCGTRSIAVQLSPTESQVDLSFARPGCVFSCTAQAQFRCTQ